MRIACHIVAAVLATAPFTASGKPIGAFRFVVVEPGDQTDPSIDGGLIVYSGPGPAGSGTDVLLYDVATRATRTLAGGPGEQHAPDVQGGAAIFLDAGGVAILGLAPEQSLRPPAADGDVAAPAVSPDAAAWELGPPGARDIRVRRLRDGAEYTLASAAGEALAGDQFAPAVFGPLVGFVDGEDGGAAWLHDSAAGTRTRICAGAATGVSVGHDGAGVVVAVARATAEHDEDVEIYDSAGNLLAALRVPGVQRNPHLSRDWVAFEDVSTELAQVVVWNWTTGLVFVPHPTRTAQILNDLSFEFPEEVRVVFEDSAAAGSGRDIALYVLDVYPEILFDDEPDGYPLADPEPAIDLCDPATPALATLALSRGADLPEAGRVEFAVELPDGAAALPVVVCIEAERVSAAWVALDDVAVASPSDFEPAVVSLARPASLDAGTARLSGVVAGKPGAWLRARVVVDPSREGTAGGATAEERLVPSAARGYASGGCGSGCAGLLSLLAPLALLPARARRRA